MKVKSGKSKVESRKSKVESMGRKVFGICHFLLLSTLCLSLFTLTGCGLLDRASSGLPSTDSATQSVTTGTNIVLVGNANWSGGARSISSILHSETGTINTSLIADDTGAAFEPGSGINDIQVCDNKAYIVNSTAGTIQIIDLNTGEQKEFNIGSSPEYCVVVSANEVYVDLYYDGQILKLDTTVAESQNPIMDTLTLPTGSDLSAYNGGSGGYARPWSMRKIGNALYVALNNLDSSYSPAGPDLAAVVNLSTFSVSKVIAGAGQNMANIYYNSSLNSDDVFLLSSGAYYSNAGLVEIYSLASESIVASWNVGGAPTAMASDSSSRIYIKDDYSNQIKRLDHLTTTFTSFDQTYTISTSYFGGMIIDDYGYLYIASASKSDYSSDNTVYIYNTNTDAFVQTVTVGYNPAAMAIWRP